MKKLFLLLALPLLFLTLWEISLLYHQDLIPLFPPPSTVLTTILTHKARLFHHLTVTLLEIGLALFWALLLSFPLAWTMERYKSFGTLIQPLFVLTQSIPMIALAPLMVLWFGWSITAIVVPTTLMLFFPLTMTLYHGFSSIPKSLLDLFTTHQATRWQLFLKLQLPSSLPHLISGLRISLSFAALAAVAGEWAGGQEGLGVFMLQARRSFDMPLTFAALTVLILLSMTLYGAVRLFEKRVAFLFLLLFSASCQQQAEKPKVTLILDWFPNPNHIPLYAGKNLGFFEEEGINLEILYSQDAINAVTTLLSNKCDLSITYMPTAVEALHAKAPIQIVGKLIDRPLNGFIYVEDGTITKPQDLNGKRLGFSIDGTDERLMTILKNNQITPSEIKNCQFDLVGMLLAHEVDFVYGAYWNIETYQLKKLGLSCNHFSTDELQVPTYHELLIIANNDSTDWQPFKRALQKSLDYSHSHPQEAFTSYANSQKDKSATTLSWEKEAWEATSLLLPSTQELDNTLFEAYSDWHIGPPAVT